MNSNFEEIKIDTSTSIKIFEEKLFYQEIEASGNFIEYQISINDIKTIKFEEKKVDKHSTGCNLLFNFISTLISSSAYHTSVEYTIPKIIIIYFKNGKMKNKIISSPYLTKQTFNRLKSNIKLNK
jgi:hypothetical protein